ncbi:MAG TPA: hypothetical protein VHW09_23140 [Bryobacteraceae bacterium]|nr:hypothetical protein [Bryobacteraceae bacterium]
MKLLLYLALPLLVLAQPRPKFDVASIKLDSGVLGRPLFEPTSLSLRHTTLPDLLQEAYASRCGS